MRPLASEGTLCAAAEAGGYQVTRKVKTGAYRPSGCWTLMRRHVVVRRVDSLLALKDALKREGVPLHG